MWLEDAEEAESFLPLVLPCSLGGARDDRDAEDGMKGGAAEEGTNSGTSAWSVIFEAVSSQQEKQDEAEARQAAK